MLVLLACAPPSAAAILAQLRKAAFPVDAFPLARCAWDASACAHRAAVADAFPALPLRRDAGAEKLAAPELDVPALGAVQWAGPAVLSQSEPSAGAVELHKPDVAQSAALSPGARELLKLAAVSPVSLCLPVR